MGSIDDIGRRMNAIRQVALRQRICRIARGVFDECFVQLTYWTLLNENMSSDFHFQRMHYSTVPCEFIVFADGAITSCSI